MSASRGSEQTGGSPVRRVRVVYRGRVQGVGFRYTARGLARRHGVVGFVRNCPDGTVELVAEGPSDSVDQLLEAIDRAFRGYIREAEVRDWPSTERFDRFEIRF